MAQDESIRADDLGRCPFCKGFLSACVRPDGTHDSINHTMPPCEKYVDLDALSFVIAVNVEKAKQAGTPGLS
jgi:hypothetical protein